MTENKSQKMIELTAAERAALERIASAEPPHSQRAQGLIVMADGGNLAEAGMASGLTINQMRHWLGRFGTRRLSIFPEELLVEETLEEEVEQTPLLLDAPEEELLLEAPEELVLLKAPELAGELPESIPDSAVFATAASTAGGVVVVKVKKGKKDKKSGKEKKSKKGKNTKKNKKSKKDKKDKKSKKGKNSKKNKNDKKSKKNKKNKKNKKKK